MLAQLRQVADDDVRRIVLQNTAPLHGVRRFTDTVVQIHTSDTVPPDIEQASYDNRSKPISASVKCKSGVSRSSVLVAIVLPVGHCAFGSCFPVPIMHSQCNY